MRKEQALNITILGHDSYSNVEKVILLKSCKIFESATDKALAEASTPHPPTCVCALADSHHSPRCGTRNLVQAVRCDLARLHTASVDRTMRDPLSMLH
jgi:hypothetical protein